MTEKQTPRLPKSIRKHIRGVKAELGRGVLSREQQRTEFDALYKKFYEIIRQKNQKTITTEPKRS